MLQRISQILRELLQMAFNFNTSIFRNFAQNFEAKRATQFLFTDLQQKITKEWTLSKSKVQKKIHFYEYPTSDLLSNFSLLLKIKLKTHLFK